MIRTKASLAHGENRRAVVYDTTEFGFKITEYVLVCTCNKLGIINLVPF